MAIIKCITKSIHGLSFVSEFDGHKIVMDAKKESGGGGIGPTPKELLLAGIAGCSGMDVVSLLKKNKFSFSSCLIEAETETVPNHPAIFKQVKLVYKIESSETLPQDQVFQCVKASMTKFCGVSAMVYKTSPIHFEVFLNGQNVGEGTADFGI